MTRVDIADGRMKVEVLGWHKLWAFKSRLEFPLEHVVAIRRWDRERDRLSWRTIRAPGTSLPGVIVAGTYHNKGRHFFYDVCKFADAIVVELKEEWYDRLVIEVENEEAFLRHGDEMAAPVSV